jgi:hypothetical protein
MVHPTRVDLPADVTSAYEVVFVNGVPQARGKEYEQVDRSLFFARALKQEGRLGFWRWASIFLGIAGTYREDDWVVSSMRGTVSGRLRRGCQSRWPIQAGSRRPRSARRDPRWTRMDEVCCRDNELVPVRRVLRVEKSYPDAVA